MQIPPSRSSYNNLINACGSSGQWEAALDICKRMSTEGVGPDTVTHNIILSAFKNGGQYRKVLAYFEHMKSCKLVFPDRISYNTVLHCLIKLEYYDKAVDLYNDMKKLTSISCEPDTVTYNNLIHLYAVQGQITNARAVFEKMVAEGVHPTIVSFNTLISAYGSLGLVAEAQEIFDLLLQSKIAPDVVSYSSLIHVHGKCEQPAKAREIYEKMKNYKVKPNVVSFNILIDALGPSEDFSIVFALLHDMDSMKLRPDVVTMCSLLAAAKHGRDPEKISVVVSEATKRRIKLNATAYNVAIAAHMEMGASGRAMQMYKDMNTAGISPDSVTFGSLIDGLGKEGRLIEAQELYCKMIEMDIPRTVQVCTALIDAYAKKVWAFFLGLIVAETIEHALWGFACRATFFCRYVSIISLILIMGLCGAWLLTRGLPHLKGFYEKAQTIFDDMALHGCKPNVITYTSMINGYLLAGQIPSACNV